MFNIILKLNNHTWKKLQNNFFCGKRWVPNQWFCSREKSSESLKKKLFQKKILPAYLCGYDPQNVVEIFLK